tara:strand:- start:300 stop:536 length:237 start_codon:yes stop_codon:yes gene_type:complete
MSEVKTTFDIIISFKNKQDAKAFFYEWEKRFNLTDPMMISNEDGTAFGVTVEDDPQLVTAFYKVLRADDSVIDYDSEE